MIGRNIAIKLEGLHYEAFRSFALRSSANNSKENFKRLIETLPEFQSLHRLNVRENINPSLGSVENTTGAQNSQADNKGAA